MYIRVIRVILATTDIEVDAQYLAAGFSSFALVFNFFILRFESISFQKQLITEHLKMK